MPYRLHYFPESGNSYKLALMLTPWGEQWEPVWTDFGGGVTRSPKWRATVNEMGEIPVLEEDGMSPCSRTACDCPKEPTQYLETLVFIGAEKAACSLGQPGQNRCCLSESDNGLLEKAFGGCALPPLLASRT